MKNSPLRIGLTGGIGTGKSTISQIFKILGVPVYDADSMAKRLMGQDKDLISAIKGAFSNESYRNGELNRQFLADKVFTNEHLLTKLNALVHPFVARHFENWCNKHNDNYIVKEAALLFETGSYLKLDYVILVISPLEIRIARVKKRDPQRSSAQILSIIESQIPADEAGGLADFIINNDEINMLIPQVLNLQKRLIKKG